MRYALLAVLVGALAGGAGADWVDGSPPVSGPRSPSATAAAERPPLLKDVGLDPHLGASLPLDAVFRDDTGTARPFGEWIDDRDQHREQRDRGVVDRVPRLDLFVCRHILLQRLRELRRPRQRDIPGSFVGQRYGRPGTDSGWRFLTGDAEAIRRLTDAVGFRYAWDAAGAQFAHVAVVTVVTPDGRLARYFPGIDYPPRDVRLALVEASAGRIGTAVDRLLLFCYHWDAATGRYTPIVARVCVMSPVLAKVASRRDHWYLSATACCLRMRQVKVASARMMLSWPPVALPPTPLTKYSRAVKSSAYSLPKITRSVASACGATP